MYSSVHDHTVIALAMALDPGGEGGYLLLELRERLSDHVPNVSTRRPLCFILSIANRANTPMEPAQQISS